MHFPQIIKEKDRKKKAVVNGTPICSLILTAHNDDFSDPDRRYTIFIHSKFDRDPFIKAMMTRIQQYIEKNYS